MASGVLVVVNLLFFRGLHAGVKAKGVVRVKICSVLEEKRKVEFYTQNQ